MLARLLAHAAPGPVVMDGGMGTSLEDRGIPCRSALWASLALLTSEGLATNDAIHREFAAAGAEILIANTHNASHGACRAFLDGDGPGLDPPEDVVSSPDPAAALLARLQLVAVESARRAAGPDVLVAAGVGSAEGAYATESRLDSAEVVEALEPQVRILLDLGVELILFETLTTASEIEGVARLMRGRKGVAIGAGLTCGEGRRTLAGVSMSEAWDRLRPAKPAAVFVQCTRYDLVVPTLADLVEVVGDESVPGVYANDGRVWIDRRWHGDRVGPEEYAEAAEGWVESGALIVGGCCGTGPEHVRALRRRLRPVEP